MPGAAPRAARSPCDASPRGRRTRGRAGARLRSARAAGRPTCRAAAQLHRPVDDAADGLCDEHLGDTRLVPRGLARVERLGAAADQPAARVEVDHAVGDHGLGDALLVERRAEELALGGVVERDIERAPRKSEPAHAVRQPRRRKARLREAEAETDLAEHGIVGHPAVVEHELGVPAGERAVDRRDAPLDAHAGFAPSTMNIDAPRSPASSSSVRAMQITKAAPSAPVTKRLRPLMLQPPARAGPRCAAPRIRARSRRWLAHRERRARAARRERPQQALALLVAADDLEQVHVALVGGRAVQRGRPEQAVAGLLEHGGLRAHVEAETAVAPRDGRRQEARARVRPPAASRAAQRADRDRLPVLPAPRAGRRRARMPAPGHAARAPTATATDRTRAGGHPVTALPVKV